MRSITLGLALSLLGGVAMAQTPPAPPQPAPAQPAAQGRPTPPTPPAATPTIPTPTGAPEGMIVETPNGFYLVRPGEQAPHRLDLGQQAQPGQQPPGMAQAGPGDDMDEMADDAMPPHPPHPHKPPHPPEGKGARFRIQSPNLTVGVKCPDDEPMKACVDAVSQLLDKANAAPPH